VPASTSNDPVQTGTSTSETVALEARIAELQSQQVREWLDLIRHGTVVPLHVANSLSWRVTKPFRMITVAFELLKREGLGTVIATTIEWFRRATGRSRR
jgi:hypothetical protein